MHYSILETEADFQILIDCLGSVGHVLKGIIEAVVVDEVSHEDMNHAETSVGPAKDALVRVQARVAELEQELAKMTMWRDAAHRDEETARDELVETLAIHEAIMGALKGDEPSDFMRSFPDVEHAWWIFRLAYPKP